MYEIVVLRIFKKQLVKINFKRPKSSYSQEFSKNSTSGFIS